MDDWIGRGAVVLGANSAVGQTVTKKLMSMGMKVVGVDKDIDSLKELVDVDAKGKKLLFCKKVDLSNEEEIIEVFQEVEEIIGGANVMVNVASIVSDKSILASQNKELKKMGKVNILAGALSAREFIRSATDRFIPLGHIINISSDYALRIPKKSFYHVHAGFMNAVFRFSQHLRQELEFRDSCIKVTNILSESTNASPIKTTNVANFDSLNPEDFADAVEYVLKTSYNVQVRDIYLERLENSE